MTMAKGYGNDQPQGFSNRIEKVAIVGVRRVFKQSRVRQDTYL